MDEAAQLRFSTEALPERERIAAFRELYGRKMLRLEMEPQPDGPFHADLTLQLLPGLGIVSADSSLLRVGRTRQLLADSDDNLILQISTSAGVASQLCREIDVPPGDAVLLSAADIGHFTYTSAPQILAVSLPRATLEPLLQDFDAALVRAVPAQNEAVRLLVRYLGMLLETCRRWQVRNCGALRERMSAISWRWLSAQRATRRKPARLAACALRGCTRSKSTSLRTSAAPT